MLGFLVLVILILTVYNIFQIRSISRKVVDHRFDYTRTKPKKVSAYNLKVGGLEKNPKISTQYLKFPENKQPGFTKNSNRKLIETEGEKVQIKAQIDEVLRDL